MPWKAELIRAFFVAFGAGQTISNFAYLIRKNGIEAAKKQHRELPCTISNKQIKIKTICMMVFGIAFFATGLFSYLTRTYHGWSFICVIGAYTAYALTEAVYYRFWRTFGAFALSAALLALAAIG